MNTKLTPRTQRMIPLLVILSMLFTSLLSPQVAQAAPSGDALVKAAGAPTATTITLDAIDDARTQSGSPDTNFGSGFLWVGHPNVHYSFVQFDLSQLPADATITGAGLQLTFPGVYTGTNEIEVGRADGAWDELTVTWATQPAVTWGGPVQTVSSTGVADPSVVTWNVTPQVQAWHTGAQPKYGFVLRGNGGELKAAYSKENGTPDRLPQLVIAYDVPADDGQPRPDLGDAPDSSNHHSQNNTAYPGAGVLGQFPTVWNVPAGQVAGPRHLNQTMEGWLGNVISREAEADQGPDQDAPRNNILRNTATGAIGDVADNDRGDDGWRNRNIKFFDCERATLDMRISKGPNASRQFMYLNAWFDGNRDGDWGDLGQCQADENEPAQASYEWIVQNYIIDMSAVPAGGYLDFAVNTQKVLNSTPNQAHWMRFTLSEEPATQPATGGLPDGRGPHPDSTLKSYQFGETEDVIQKPPPGGEDGELVVEKRVLTEGSPVAYAASVIYEIRLRNAGGSQPMQARLRDELPYPLHVNRQIDNDGNVFLIAVTSPTGGAAPLQATLEYNLNNPSGAITQVINWQGSLEPNAEVKLSFEVHIHPLCAVDQQTTTITNRVQAQPKAGDVITADATFVAACPGYNPASIQIDPELIETPIDLDGLTHVQWQGQIRNNHAVPVTLGAVFEPNNANRAEAANASVISNLRILDRITLEPNEERLVNLDLRMDVEFTDELALAEDFMVGGKLSFCFLEDESTACPDAAEYPNLVVPAPPVEIHYRPSDLGDAPDSTNHAATAMAAYAGVQADFPTVFDVTTGVPEGPLHRHPRPFHLGQRVSQEAEADIGPDQDPLNNILPAANDPDNDRGDDGTNFALWTLNNCQTTNLPVQIFISPQAVNYFQQLGTPAYVNIWSDSNRNGSWADAAQCGQQAAPEHIVIDAPVNVVGLGAGLHNIMVPTGLVPWPNSDRPAWVRISLSEIESNKTLQSGNIKHGDGRGYPNGFKTGETEDYLYRPAAAGGGPDIDVQLTAQSQKVTAQEPGLQAAAVDKLGNFEIQIFKVDLTNLGVVPVQGALLEFQIPEKLRGQQPALLRMPGIPSENISFSAGKVSMIMPFMEQGNLFRVVMGWYGCITCTLASNVTAAGLSAEYTGVASVTVDGDIDTSNNQSSATARGLLSSPILGMVVPRPEAALCNNEVIEGIFATNRSTVDLRGHAVPNQQIEIKDNSTLLGTVQSDGNGNFTYAATLNDGLHKLAANYINSPRDVAHGQATGKLKVYVKSSLPFDAASLCFIDSQGRSYPLPTLGLNKDELPIATALRAGETYQIEVYAGTNDPNKALNVLLGAAVKTSLTDVDRDGYFTGVMEIPALEVAAASANATLDIGLTVNSGSTELTFNTKVTTATDGTITDRVSGQPLADAEVSLLQAQDVEDGTTVDTAFVVQGAAQMTGGNGQYGFSAGAGTYRIDIVREGYQPYRTGNIDATTETLNQSIVLSPAIAEAATHTVYLTATGFEPATLTVKPGSVIEFVNVDLAEHGVVGSVWDSGILATGQSYLVKVGQDGTTTYRDTTDALVQGQVTVSGTVVVAEHALYLPLVQR